jgi:peptidoglycan hydrolase FlgJ
MNPISPLTLAPQAFGMDAGMMSASKAVLGLPPSMGRGFSVNGLQGALSLKTPIAGQAFGQTFQMPAMLESSTSAMALDPSRSLSDRGRTDAEVQKVAKDFEAIFLRMLLKEMRQSIQKTGLMGNSKAMEFFESMHDEQIAEHLAQAGGVGMGQIVYDQLRQTTLTHQRTTF